MIKHFIVGLLIGGISVYVFSSDLEIVIGTYFAFIAWWMKLLYEKWSNEKVAVSRLQQIYSKNQNTLSALEKIFSEIADNIETNLKRDDFVIYVNFVIPLDPITYDNIKPLRNLDLLNSVFKNGITIDRFNASLNLLWLNYQSILDSVKNGADKSLVHIQLEGLSEGIREFRTWFSSLNAEIIEVIAHLRCAGAKLKSSVFRIVDRTTIYKYTEEEILTEKGKLEQVTVKK